MTKPIEGTLAWNVASVIHCIDWSTDSNWDGFSRSHSHQTMNIYIDRINAQTKLVGGWNWDHAYVLWMASPSCPYWIAAYVMLPN